jgi:hypothetical protein
MNAAHHLDQARAVEQAAAAEVERLEARVAEAAGARQLAARALSDARAALGVQDDTESRKRWRAAVEADELAVAAAEGAVAALRAARQTYADAQWARSGAAAAAADEREAGARGKARELLTAAWQLRVDADALIAEAAKLLPQGVQPAASGWGGETALDVLWRAVAAVNGTYIPTTPNVMLDLHAERRRKDAEFEREKQAAVERARPSWDGFNLEDRARLAHAMTQMNEHQFANWGQLARRVSFVDLQTIVQTGNSQTMPFDVLEAIRTNIRKGGRIDTLMRATSTGKETAIRPFDEAAAGDRAATQARIDAWRAEPGNSDPRATR